MLSHFGKFNILLRVSATEFFDGTFIYSAYAPKPQSKISVPKSGDIDSHVLEYIIRGSKVSVS